MNRRALIPLVLLVLFPMACSDVQSPPSGDAPPPVQADLVDGSTEMEREGFFWQPPIVQVEQGDNNPDLSPVVVICHDEDLIESGEDCAVAEVFLQLDAILSSKKKENRYEATWEATQAGLEIGDILRVFAFPSTPVQGVDPADPNDVPAGFFEDPMGWFDVEITDPNLKGGNKTKTNGNHQLKLGSAFPITFRASNAFFCEDPDPARCVVFTATNEDGGSGATDPPFIALDAEPGFIPLSKQQAGVTEVTFVLQRVDITPEGASDDDGMQNDCLDEPGNSFPLQERDICVNGETFPDMMEIPFNTDADGNSLVTLGMCFDDTGLSADAIEEFQGWDNDGGIRTPLRSRPDPSLLDCGTFLASASHNPLIRLADAGWNRLARFFAPPAYATNLGNGHSVGTFSNIVWARTLVMQPAPPPEIEIESTTELTAEPGETITVSVLVTTTPTAAGDPHFEPTDYPEGTDPDPLDDAIAAAITPAEGVVVTESSVDGSVASSTVSTDVNGIATFTWNLPGPETEATEATLVLEAPALGTPLTFVVEFQSPPEITGLAPSTSLASDFDYIFRGTGNVDPFSILFTASDPDGSVASALVVAEDDQENETTLLDATMGGGFVVDPSPLVDPIDNVDLADGQYTTTITVTDDDGLTATETILYTLDTTAPFISEVVASAPESSNEQSEDVTVTGEIADVNGISAAVVRLLEDTDGDCSTTGDITSLESRDVTTDVQADGQFSETFTVQAPETPDTAVNYCVDIIADDVAQDNGTGFKSPPNQRQFRGAGFTISWNETF